MTRRLGVGLGPYGINVNCVASGYIKTDMAGAGKTPEEEAQHEKRVAGITMLRKSGLLRKKWPESLHFCPVQIQISSVGRRSPLTA
jgi:NAD(P)-dependent dehydrogenase (short-subunit alcohol dehydrogenase family)